MEVWQIFALVAVIFFILGVIHSLASSDKQSVSEGELDVADLLSLPKTWDEPAIGRQLTVASQESTTALTTYVDGLKQRFILRQNEKTAIARIDFIKKVIENGELAKKYHAVLNDLAAMKLEQENRLKKLEVEGLKLDHERAGLEEVEHLKREKEKLQIEVEMARLRREMEELQRRSEPEQPKLSAEQQRRLKRMEIEDRLSELDRLEAEALRIARTDPDRLRVQNMYADKRNELHEQLSKYLV
ncbi:MAG: hypothetical protein HY038_08670 [Nitrospirae bacterium]|nr:hypothetical protein [Nitrospirota bacterium]